MLEHVPEWLGRTIAGWRAGTDKVAAARAGLRPPDEAKRILLSSPAFADEGRLPDRFTADGEGASPPLVWGDPPAGTARLALLVEDADAPSSEPLVHALVWNLPPAAGRLAEGAIVEGAALPIGRNSFGRSGWLPPDPPTGHGVHRYVFQLFALAEGTGDLGKDPGRSALVAAIEGRILGVGLLTGTYSRGEPAAVAPAIGAVAAA